MPCCFDFRLGYKQGDVHARQFSELIVEAQQINE